MFLPKAAADNGFRRSNKSLSVQTESNVFRVRDFLPDPKLFGLDYALPAMFLALLVPQCKERLYTLAAVLSALLSVILAMYDTGRWNVIIASVITSTIGALLVTHRDRNIDALRRKA